MSSELSGQIGTTGVDLVSDASAATGLDGTLVAATKKGDSAAFGKLFVANKDRILRLARHITRSDSDADEVLQDAFTQTYFHLDDFHGDSRFATWLTRIAINQALMMLRRRRSKVTSLSDPLDIGRTGPAEIQDGRLTPTPEEDYSWRERQRLLSRAISYLDPILRAVVQLRLKGLSDQESSRELGVSSETVKSRLFRARTRLRQALDPCFRPTRLGDTQWSRTS